MAYIGSSPHGLVQGATGNGIDTVTLNSDYTLTITFTDGSAPHTTDPIRGEQGVGVSHTWTGDGTTLEVTSASGTTSANLKGEVGAASTEPGPTGPQGPGITHAWSGTELTLTDEIGTGAAVDLRGAPGLDSTEPGPTGNGIASTVHQSNNTLLITFTDGSTYTTGVLRGDDGEDGVSPTFVLNGDVLTITTA